MAVVSGQIDATILPEPLLSKAVASGKATKLMSAEGLISGLTVVAVRSDFAKEQPDLVKRYLRVQKESIDWGTANLENALKLTATKNQMDLNAVKKLYPEFSFDMSLDDVKVGLISSAVFLKKEKMLKPDVDINKLVDSLIDTSFLPQK
jgi:sulfonate transport system substrate-binding protein